MNIFFSVSFPLFFCIYIQISIKKVPLSSAYSPRITEPLSTESVQNKNYGIRRDIEQILTATNELIMHSPLWHQVGFFESLVGDFETNTEWIVFKPNVNVLGRSNIQNHEWPQKSRVILLYALLATPPPITLLTD